MHPPRNPSSQPRPAEGGDRPNQRRHGRIVCHYLTCGLGHVLDLSASGMRVSHRGSLGLSIGQVVKLRLCSDRGALLVKARVVQIRKAGFRRHQLGLEFVETTPEIRAGLSALARAAADDLTIGRSSVRTL